MIRNLTLLLSIPLLLPAFAASGGPDAYGYTWKDNFEPDGPVYSWIDITSTGVQVTGLGDDNIVGPYVMETNMGFYWYNRKNVWIGSNGYIAFTNGNIASPFPVIPAIGGTNDYITGMMADLNHLGIGNPAQVWWHDEVDMTIISYINVPFWSPTAPTFTGSNTFQIILNKLDNTITIQFQQQTGLTQNTDITIGIESVAGSIGLQHTKNIYPTANYAILYEPPPIPLIAVSDATVDWNTTPGSGGRFLARNGVTFSMVTNVLNIGNENVGNFTVTGAILNSSSQQLVSDQEVITSLIPEQQATIYFDPTWVPNTAGTFRFTSTITGIAGELVTTNNQRVQELVVVDTTTMTQDLRYHGAVDDGIGLSWNGGNGGVAVHIIPPYHPAQVTHTTVRIVSNTGNSGFYMKVFDDDGPNGAPGTLLDSVHVAPAQATPGDKVIPLTAPAIIGSGGIYVLWYMGGINIAIAQDITPPFSLRTYEVLDGVWAEYRDRENIDFFLGARLTQMPVIDVGCDGFFGLDNGQPVAAPVTVRTFIHNYGNQPATDIPVSYRYGTGPIVQQTYTGTPIQPGQQTLFSFSEQFTPTEDGFGNLCAWTGLGPDGTLDNDTTCVTIETITGLTDRTQPSAVLVPNPANDVVWINGLDADNYDLAVFDSRGRQVEQRRITVGSGPIQITIRDLAQGTYLMQLQGTQGLFQARLVVSR